MSRSTRYRPPATMRAPEEVEIVPGVYLFPGRHVRIEGSQRSLSTPASRQWLFADLQQDPAQLDELVELLCLSAKLGPVAFANNEVSRGAVLVRLKRNTSRR